MKYLTYCWQDKETQTILDGKDKVANECCNFINEALNKGDSVLIHSINAKNRSLVIIATWMMRRYKWSLKKTFEYLHWRKPDLQIRHSFERQLIEYENKLLAQGLGPKTTKWGEIYERTNNFENEELLIRNTFLNAQMGPVADLTVGKGQRRVSKVKWIDQSKAKIPLATTIEMNPCERKTNPSEKFISSTKNPKTNSKEIEPKPDKKHNPREPTSNSKKTIPTNPNSDKRSYKNNKQVKNIPNNTGIAKDYNVNQKVNNYIGIDELDTDCVHDQLLDEHNRHLIDEKIIEKGNRNYIGPVTHIINQNNINNYIIQNPKEIQVIEEIEEPIQQPIIKKVVAKKVNSSSRPASASVKRDSGISSG